MEQHTVVLVLVLLQVRASSKSSSLSKLPHLVREGKVVLMLRNNVSRSDSIEDAILTR